MSNARRTYNMNYYKESPEMPPWLAMSNQHWVPCRRWTVVSRMIIMLAMRFAVEFSLLLTRMTSRMASNPSGADR